MTDRITLNKRNVDASKVPASGELRVWDDKLAGFCLRLYAPSLRSPEGRKVYAVKYRVNGRQGWYTIGEHGKAFEDANQRPYESLTPDLARAAAVVAIGAAKAGNDPHERKAARVKPLTVAELADRYLKEGRKKKLAKRKASWTADQSNLERHVKPLIGKLSVNAVTSERIGEMLDAIANGETAKVEKTKARGKAIVRGGEGAATRVLAVTKAMFNWAMGVGLMTGPNPCGGVTLPARETVERFLSTAESIALLGVIGELEADGEITTAQGAIFKLLLLTGARRNEIAALRWADVDLDKSVIALPPSRTKSGAKTGGRNIALNSMAHTILKELPREGRSAYVFPATKGKSGHTTTATKVWNLKVRPAAKLTDVRLHDLRHSFASMALADGMSLAMIGKALGHRSSRSTERYSHANLESLREVADRVGDRFSPEKKDD